jgi:hypothetical protein
MKSELPENLKEVELPKTQKYYLLVEKPSSNNGWISCYFTDKIYDMENFMVNYPPQGEYKILEFDLPK